MKTEELKLRNLLSKIFKISPESITDATSPDNVETWDSFNGLMLSAELEKTFNVTFTIDEIITTKNVGDVKNNLRVHGVEI